MIETIVIATDGSELAGKAVELGADLAAKYGAKVVLLHVLLRGHLPEGLLRAAQVEHVARPGPSETRNLVVMPPEIMARVESSRQVPLDVLEFIGGKVMEAAEDVVRDKGVARIETAVEQGDPATQILDKAQQAGADVIVMGSRGLGGLAGLLMGSVSQKVSHHAPCTCITVK
jgi:nucleotide-binding universal stress UspA family protein